MTRNAGPLASGSHARQRHALVKQLGTLLQEPIHAAHPRPGTNADT